MSGLLGALRHPGEVKHALVIGLGTGSTAGWLAELPQLEQVDVVELEPGILRVADTCTAVNRDVLRNNKVNIIIGDAREVLLTTPRKYDVIFSEPSNPYRAGVASLNVILLLLGARPDRKVMALIGCQDPDRDGNVSEQYIQIPRKCTENQSPNYPFRSVPSISVPFRSVPSPPQNPSVPFRHGTER